MKYSIKEMKKLYESIQNNLDEEQKEIVNQIMNNYNQLFIYAREKKQYLERKEKNYADEMKENQKLLEENIKLKEKVNSQKNRIDILVKENKQLNKKTKLL